MARTKADHTVSSGNVFADLGLRNPDDMVLRADVALTIARAIAAKGWTQVAAAKHLGVSQSDVSDITRGKISKFTLERLFRLLVSLKHDVEIRVSNAPKGRAVGRVKVTHKEVTVSI